MNLRPIPKFSRAAIETMPKEAGMRRDGEVNYTTFNEIELAESDNGVVALRLTKKLGGYQSERIVIERSDFTGELTFASLDDFDTFLNRLVRARQELVQ